MIFDVGLQRRGSKTKHILKPAMSYDILSGTQVTIYFRTRLNSYSYLKIKQMRTISILKSTKILCLK